MGFRVDEISIMFVEQRHMPASFKVGKDKVTEIKVLENGVELVHEGPEPDVFYPIHVIFKLSYVPSP